MLAPEMTLAAALRDALHDAPEVRVAGVRNLAPALLSALELPGPRWQADREHPEGAAVLGRLLAALEDPHPEVRGHAILGLGWIGRDELIDTARSWIEGATTGDRAGVTARGDPPAGEQDPGHNTAEDLQWLAETALIALALVGQCAPTDAPTRERVTPMLRDGLTSSEPAVRFQAALGLVDVVGSEAEPVLVGALARESHAEVRCQIVVALSHLPKLSPATLDRLATYLNEVKPHTNMDKSPQDNHFLHIEDTDSEALTFELAMVLAGAHRAEAGARLVMALGRRGPLRDRALEALAVLGQAAVDSAEAIHRILIDPRTPGITRVRAAYALRRVQPPPAAGRHRADTWLKLLAWHPRPAVRNAVADAIQALQSLDDAAAPVP